MLNTEDTAFHLAVVIFAQIQIHEAVYSPPNCRIVCVDHLR